MTHSSNNDVTFDVKGIIVYAATTVIGVLFAGNIFFITRLIAKTETLTDEMWNLRQQVTIITYRLDEIQKGK